MRLQLSWLHTQRIDILAAQPDCKCQRTVRQLQATHACCLAYAVAQAGRQAGQAATRQTSHPALSFSLSPQTARVGVSRPVRAAHPGTRPSAACRCSH